MAQFLTIASKSTVFGTHSRCALGPCDLARISENCCIAQSTAFDADHFGQIVLTLWQSLLLFVFLLGSVRNFDLVAHLMDFWERALFSPVAEDSAPLAHSS